MDNAFFSKLKLEYISIFKAGMVVLSIALAGISQTYPVITKFDYEARALQYKIEAQEKKDFEKIDCKSIVNNVAECKLAAYKLSANNNAMNMAGIFIVFSFYLGVFLVLLSVIGFILQVIDEYRKNV